MSLSLVRKFGLSGLILVALCNGTCLSMPGPNPHLKVPIPPPRHNGGISGKMMDRSTQTLKAAMIH